jgi:hypothetical protein
MVSLKNFYLCHKDLIYKKLKTHRLKNILNPAGKIKGTSEGFFNILAGYPMHLLQNPNIHGEIIHGNYEN